MCFECSSKLAHRGKSTVNHQNLLSTNHYKRHTAINRFLLSNRKISLELCLFKYQHSKLNASNKKYKPNVFPIDSLKEDMFFYFWYTARANTVFSITAKPAHRMPVGSNLVFNISLQWQHTPTKYSIMTGSHHTRSKLKPWSFEHNTPSCQVCTTSSKFCCNVKFYKPTYNTHPNCSLVFHLCNSCNVSM